MRYCLSWLILASLAVATPAAAQDLSTWKPAGVHGPWSGALAQVPSHAELMAAWPEKASRKGLAGNALALCKADNAGTISDCRLVVERPAVNGFGDALLALAPKYRLAPARRSERPAAADVFISATWPVPDTPPDWPTPVKAGDFAVAATSAAWRAGKPANVLMNCTVTVLGGLRRCMVVYQDPPGLGFGQMTLRFAPYIKLKPATLGGGPVAVGVTIPFRYAAPGSDP